MKAPDSFTNTVARVHSARRAWLARRCAVAILQFFGIVSAVLLLLIAAELFLRPAATVRSILFWGGGVSVAGIAGAMLLFNACRGCGAREIIDRIQQQFPPLGGRLGGAFDLSSQAGACPLVDAALSQVAEDTHDLDFSEAARVGSLRRRLLPSCAVIVVAALIFALLPERAGNAFSRLLLPGGNQEVIGEVRILSIAPGDSELVEGADLEVTVKVDRADENALLELQAPGKKKQGRRLSLTDEKSFGYTLRKMEEDTRYRAIIGGSASKWYSINVIPRPAVTDISARIVPPSYTRLNPFTCSKGSIRAPAGSRIHLRLKTNHPVREGSMRLSSGVTVPLTIADGILEGEFTPRVSCTYTVSLLDVRGNTNANPIERPIECVTDRVPQLRFAKPSSGRKIGLGQVVSLLIDASDEYGLKEVKLFFRRNRRGEPQLLKSWGFSPGATEVHLPYELALTAPDFDVGDTVTLLATGIDSGKDGERTGRSREISLMVVDLKKVARKESLTLEKVMQKLSRLLDEQKLVHAATSRLMASSDFTKVASQLSRRQSMLRTGVLDASGMLAKLDNQTARRIRTVLLGLSGNELAQAVSGLEKLLPVDDADSKRTLISAVMPAQAEVIKRLAQILGILPELKESVEKPAEKEEGKDLTPESKAAMQKLKDNLDKFKAEQKKILEATKDLAKKPVDDFNDDDRKKLEELRAAEENLKNFLKDVNTDLSKVPKQDFSNPSLLGEVIAVLEEVELAEGALAMKETKIATTAEGTAVELAESMTTHLEKWLSDKPDRVAWEMEEPLEDYETPMAELPDKLEDIIGELIEDEEELMDEVADQSSSWADSLDKGAGWDAADGPMSNYSAQGVTGNVLPDSSEVGGRSGEGRQGKSHGEMVSDTAVGKGGRKTPSRLTPDSYEKGEIDDKSKDASGGATGGGKGGAAGGEGLEGAPPPPEKGPLPRLLGRQSELRNRAERLNIKLKLMGYNTAVLENTLAEFRSVENDMKSGRYRDASRRAKYAIGNLKSGADALVGEAAVRADKAARLPRDLQREIMDALDAGMPKGYEDLVKAYYEKIAEE